MDAPQAANSGHRDGDGAGAARPRAVHADHEVRPDRPDWPDRDRFVLSAGHASILLYSMLYLTGFGLELDDLKQFRQWGSADARPPRGAPHRRASRSPPVRSARASPTASAWASPSATCGPASAPTSCDHHTFVICSDGDLEEGISHEAASLAGHLGLGRLVYVYDDNHITIDGPTELALQRRRRRSASRPTAGTSSSSARSPTTSTRSRPRSARAMAVEDRPVADRPAQPHRLARRRSSPTPPTRTATRSAPTRSRVTKEILGLPPDETSTCPTTCSSCYRDAGAAAAAAPRGVGRARSPTGTATAPSSTRASPAAASTGGTPSCPTWRRRREGRHPRAPASACLNAIARRRARARRRRRRPHRQHRHRRSKDARRPVAPTSPAGRQIHFGIREHGMGAIMNGMALHGGVAARRRHVLRVQRLHAAGRCGSPRSAEAKVVFVVDARLGRPRRGRPDAPADRAPRVAAGDARPARDPPGRRQRDRAGVARRTSTATGPTALILTRQNVPGPRRHRRHGEVEPRARTCCREAPRRRPTLVLIGTGCEVSVCVDAADAARRARASPSASCRCRRGSCSRRRPTSYRDAVLPPGVPTLAVEAGGDVRLGALRRRRRRHRPLRRVGARRRGRSTSSASPPSTSPSARTRCSSPDREGGTSMTTSCTQLYDEQGQSPWLDNLTRGYITSGELASAGSTRGIRGVTSNPTIFQKAIDGSADYDEQFSELAGDGASGRSTTTGTLVIARHRRRARRPAPGLRRERRRRRLRVGRGRARPRPRHRTARSTAARAPARARSTGRTCIVKIPAPPRASRRSSR